MDKIHAEISVKRYTAMIVQRTKVMNQKNAYFVAQVRQKRMLLRMPNSSTFANPVASIF